jgi:AGCS family alanine or glycine:cation symporter
VISSFGSGNSVQAFTMADSFRDQFHLPTWLTGGVSATLVALVILGGIRRIGNFTSRIVPVMAALYVLTALVVLVLHAGQIPGALAAIVTGAFNPAAAVGGFAGSTFIFTLIWGVKRGLFSNEAGQGSAPIAHAAARTDEPVREGAVALLEPFIDTLMICTLTGLVIICTGAWHTKKDAAYPLNAQSNITIVSDGCELGRTATLRRCALPPGRPLIVREGKVEGARFVLNQSFVDRPRLTSRGRPAEGQLLVDDAGRPSLIGSGGRRLPVELQGRVLQNASPLTALAFDLGLAPLLPRGLPVGPILVTISVFLFALSTAIGWSYYGDRSAQYLLGERAVLPYKLVFVAMHFVGAVVSLDVVWGFGDAALGSMSFPNLIAILALSPTVARLSREYFARDHEPVHR